MASSTAPYSLLASSEKAPLDPPAYSPATLEAKAEAPQFPQPEGEARADAPAHTAARRRRRAVLFSLLAILTGSVLVATGLGVGAMNGLCSGGPGRAGVVAHQAGGNADERRPFKREVTTIPGETASESHAAVSTHTYSDGNVSSFGWSTRPIVNPGG